MAWLTVPFFLNERLLRSCSDDKRKLKNERVKQRFNAGISGQKSPSLKKKIKYIYMR